MIMSQFVAIGDGASYSSGHFLRYQRARNIDRARIPSGYRSTVQFRKVDFCGFHVEVALAQRRCRKVRTKSVIANADDANSLCRITAEPVLPAS